MTTTTPVVTVTTARTLLDAGQCSALCLLATSTPRTCTCRCAGTHHGVLGEAPVPTVEPTQAAA